MKNRSLERLKRKRLRHEKDGITAPIDPITGENIGPGAEQHHIAGRRYHDDTIPLMPTGHHMVTDAFRDMPAAMAGSPHELERIGRYFLGVVTILDFVLDREYEMGERLIAMARTIRDHEAGTKPGGTAKPSDDK